jgi:hypothetical protein
MIPSQFAQHCSTCSTTPAFLTADCADRTGGFEAKKLQWHGNSWGVRQKPWKLTKQKWLDVLPTLPLQDIQGMRMYEAHHFIPLRGKCWRHERNSDRRRNQPWFLQTFCRANPEDCSFKRVLVQLNLWTLTIGKSNWLFPQGRRKHAPVHAVLLWPCNRKIHRSRWSPRKVSWNSTRMY